MRHARLSIAAAAVARRAGQQNYQQGRVLGHSAAAVHSRTVQYSSYNILHNVVPLTLFNSILTPTNKAVCVDFKDFPMD